MIGRRWRVGGSIAAASLFVAGSLLLAGSGGAGSGTVPPTVYVDCVGPDGRLTTDCASYRPGQTKTYVWNGVVFEVPASWLLTDYDGGSNTAGPAFFAEGPFFGTVRVGSTVSTVSAVARNSSRGTEPPGSRSTAA